MSSHPMQATQRYLLSVEKNLEKQHEATTENLRVLLDSLNHVSGLERAWAARDEAWKESAEGIASRINRKLDVDGLLDEIYAQKQALQVFSGRLTSLRDALGAFDDSKCQ